MKSFALTSKAKADLRAIAIFTEERWGKEQRSLYVKQFDDAFHMLANAPLHNAAITGRSTQCVGPAHEVGDGSWLC